MGPLRPCFVLAHRAAFPRTSLAVSMGTHVHARLLSRSTTSQMHDNHPKIIDKENKSLHGEQAPGYDEALDSASGAAIKADRNPTDPKQLENETADFVRMKHGQQTDGSQEPEPSAPTPSEESVRADKFSNNPKTLQEETVKKQRLHH